MKDECGKDIKEGQIVHVHLNQVFHATIVEVRELPVIVGPKKVQPPQIVLQIILPLPSDERGIVPVYIVRSAPEQSKVSIQ